MLHNPRHFAAARIDTYRHWPVFDSYEQLLVQADLYQWLRKVDPNGNRQRMASAGMLLLAIGLFVLGWTNQSLIFVAGGIVFFIITVLFLARARRQ